MTSNWKSSQIEALGAASYPTSGVIRRPQVRKIREDRFYWDFCPVFDFAGSVAVRDGAELWLAISSPMLPDAAERHDNARLRILARRHGEWTDQGNLLPDAFSPGSREWAGFARLDEQNTLELHYTATGVRGEKTLTYLQRIMQASAVLDRGGSRFRTDGWCDLGESVAADGVMYSAANETEGEPGFIKAFRDPFIYCDKNTGIEYLLFAATIPRPETEFAGAIGIARRPQRDDCWELMPPLVHADGVTNELERPHMLERHGRCYLFWSTQGWTFRPGIDAPTGLYGMVGPTVEGPFEPINDSGLVVANPAEAPYQAYSWMVLPDLSVVSFVDMIDGELRRRGKGPALPDGAFEGTVAPVFGLQLDYNHPRVRQLVD